MRHLTYVNRLSLQQDSRSSRWLAALASLSLGCKYKSASHTTLTMWQRCSKEEVSDLPGLDWEPAATYEHAVMVIMDSHLSPTENLRSVTYCVRRKLLPGRERRWSHSLWFCSDRDLMRK